MSEFLTSYRARLQRNHETLLAMKAELESKGCRVHIPYKVDEKPHLLTWFTVIKDKAHCHFGFSEVPYRWYINISWKPNLETGSGKTVKTIWHADNLLTADDIISHMAVTDYKLPED
jgi:hypothetical protein